MHFYAMHVIMHLSMFTPRGGAYPGNLTSFAFPRVGKNMKFDIFSSPRVGEFDMVAQ